MVMVVANGKGDDGSDECKEDDNNNDNDDEGCESRRCDNEGGDKGGVGGGDGGDNEGGDESGDEGGDKGGAGYFITCDLLLISLSLFLSLIVTNEFRQCRVTNLTRREEKRGEEWGGEGKNQ